MAQEDVDSLLSKAGNCADGECSIDEVDELLSILKQQQKELYSRVQQVKETINQLEHVNQKDERKVDEVRETVRALFRVFQLGDKASGNDYPSLSKPMGYPGEVGKGPTTAYDALPPKKWKA
jgi:chromosome segregation ATPase